MLNTTVLMGRLTADPELRHTPNDIPVTSFTLAVERSYVKSGTDRQTDFIDIVAWRATAQFVCKYFHKGQLVAVQGSIQTRSYQDKEGNKRKGFEIVADNVYFAEPKRDYNRESFEGRTPPPPHEDNQRSSFDEQEVSFSNGDNDDFGITVSDDDLPF